MKEQQESTKVYDIISIRNNELVPFFVKGGVAINLQPGIVLPPHCMFCARQQVSIIKNTHK